MPPNTWTHNTRSRTTDTWYKTSYFRCQVCGVMCHLLIVRKGNINNKCCHLLRCNVSDVRFPVLCVTRQVLCVSCKMSVTTAATAPSSGKSPNMHTKQGQIQGIMCHEVKVIIFLKKIIHIHQGLQIPKHTLNFVLQHVFSLQIFIDFLPMKTCKNIIF